MQTSFRIIGLLWLAWIVYWLVAAAVMRQRAAVRRIPTPQNALMTVPTIIGLILLSAHRRLPSMLPRIVPWSPAIGVICVALVAVGLIVCIWARNHIGKNWSGRVIVQTGHQLVRTGPYRFVRHPIYSGILLMLLGTAIERGTIAGVCGFILLLIAIVWKLSLEEQLMSEQFGDDYRQYRREVKALVPGVV
jgi:protein-S-isoprenylcysteine O-methyltransferase Ste14